MLELKTTPNSNLLFLIALTKLIISNNYKQLSLKFKTFDIARVSCAATIKYLILSLLIKKTEPPLRCEIN